MEIGEYGKEPIYVNKDQSRPPLINWLLTKLGLKLYIHLTFAILHRISVQKVIFQKQQPNQWYLEYLLFKHISNLCLLYIQLLHTRNSQPKSAPCIDIFPLLYITSVKLVILFHENSFYDVSRKCILPNMIGVVNAPITFGKTHFLLTSENEFTHEIKCNGITSFMESVC